MNSNEIIADKEHLQMHSPCFQALETVIPLQNVLLHFLQRSSGFDYAASFAFSQTLPYFWPTVNTDACHLVAKIIWQTSALFINLIYVQSLALILPINGAVFPHFVK
jgi:hypothetical protein